MKKINVILILLLYKLILDISYVKFVVPIFQEYPLIINNIKLFESYVLTFVLGLLIANWFGKLIQPSYIVIYILLLNLILPMLSYYGLTDGYRSYIYISCASIILIMLIVKKTKLLSVFYFKENKIIFTFITIALSTIVFLDIIANGGLSRLNFDILQVYDVRKEFNSNKGGLMGYFLPWVAYSVNTILLSLFLYKSKYIIALVILVFQLFIFATTGFKSFLFAPILVLLIHYFIHKKKRLNVFPFLTIGFIFILLIGLIKYFVQHDLVFGSIFIRRNFFVPAHIHTMYYEFFTLNPFVMLSNSIFSSFIDYPYLNPRIVEVVSNYFYNREFGLNVGFIGNAYMNFGYIGVIIFSIIMGYVLKFLDSVSKNLPLSLAVSSIVIPSVAFVNSGLLTSMLTHGFGLSIFLLWMLASSKNSLVAK